jgi:hypothetical protein
MVNGLVVQALLEVRHQALMKAFMLALSQELQIHIHLVPIDQVRMILTTDQTHLVDHQVDLRVTKDQRLLLQHHTLGLQVLQVQDLMIAVQEPVVAALAMVQAHTVVLRIVVEVLLEVQVVAHRAVAAHLRHLLLVEVQAEAQVEARDNILKDFSPLIFFNQNQLAGIFISNFSKIQQ